MTTSTPLPAAIYTRISRDDRGDEAGVRRQETDCRELAERLGYSVAAVLVDNDRGASTRSRKDRPAYRELLDRARRGEFSAILAYSTSRLTRRPRESEDLIELVEHGGVSIKTVVSGDYRLDTADGRAVARTLAAWDAAEAERTAERVARAVRERAQEGRTHGIAPWGWTRDENGREALDADSAPLVKEAASRVLAGETLRRVASDLNDRKIATPSGKGRWNSTVLRQVLLRERNAGRAVYRGEVVGKGQWPSILSEGEQDQLSALLRDPARRASRGTEVRYLMSGRILCGRCGARCRSQVGPKFTRRDGTEDRRPWKYTCPECFGVSAKASDVDEAVEYLAVKRLSAPDGPTVLAADPKAIEEASAELAGLRARLDRAADDYADGLIEATQLARITARNRPRIEEADRKLAAAMPSPALAKFAAEARKVSVAEAWRAAPLDVRRTILDALAAWTLLPSGSGRKWTPERVGYEWLGRTASPTS